MGNSGRNWGKCMPPTHSFAIEKIFAKNDFIKKYKWTIGESQSRERTIGWTISGQ